MSKTEEMAEDIREAAGEKTFQILLFAVQVACAYADDLEADGAYEGRDFDTLGMSCVRLIMERELEQNPTVVV